MPAGKTDRAVARNAGTEGKDREKGKESKAARGNAGVRVMW